MQSLGTRLREERLKRGLELAAIAEDLRISSRYLRAIEEGDWDQLPEGFFGRSFIRQYAKALGFNPAGIEAEISVLQQDQPVEAPPVLVVPQRLDIHVPPLPVAHRGMHSFQKLLVSLAVLVAVIWGCSFLYERWQSWRVVELARVEGGTTEPVGEPPAPRTAAPQMQPAGGEAPGSGLLANVTASQGDPGAAVTLEISALETTWVEVTSEGRRVFSGILEPGQVRQFPGVQAARLLIGNAGGVSVRRKGQDIGPIGPRGQVRVVKVSEQSYEIEPPRGPQSD
jgi:cytoskeletal protein RodZ